MIEEEKSISSSSNKPLGYTKGTAHYWPYPATDENKMVYQLDDVAKESEEKASEIFDIIEAVSDNFTEKELNAKNIINAVSSNIKLFTILNTKFPDIEVFKKTLSINKSVLSDTSKIADMLQNSGDSMMSIMDIMQYQDIHRQKIERVINVMRSLSNYMNNLLESKISDKRMASSAQHIAGDTHNDLASIDDIEALLAQFGNQNKE